MKQEGATATEAGTGLEGRYAHTATRIRACIPVAVSLSQLLRTVKLFGVPFYTYIS